MHPRRLLEESFRVAVAAVAAESCLPAHLPPPPKGRTLVVGAGKAAAAMAATVEAHWPPEAPLDGLVITRHGHGCPTRRINVVEAGHPLPDASGIGAAGEILDLVARPGPSDLVLALISGGGSSLLTLPAAGLELSDLRRMSADLLRGGAPIQDINVVRKHLSTTLGGRLAAACKVPVKSLIISDVVGDDPSHIASGPFAPDPSTYADALTILARRRVTVPEPIRLYLERGKSGLEPETPKPGEPVFSHVNNLVIANGATALAAAAEFFQARNIRPLVLGDRFSGEARDLADDFARRCKDILLGRAGIHPPCVLLSGGETSVHVRGAGRGGRNGEFALALALALSGEPRVHALAADTDGIDGTEANAGAFIYPGTLERGRLAGLDAQVFLEDNDAYGYFAPLGDLLVTGPTLTNANDYRAILIT